MANRTMQAKTVKLRRQRRAFAKKLAYRGMSVPNREILGEYKMRAKGLEIDENDEDNLIRAIYKRDPWTGMTEARREVLRRLVHIREAVPEMLFFWLPGYPNSVVGARIFFNAQKNCFILAEDDYRRGIMKVSLASGNKHILIDLWSRGKLTWQEFKPLPKPS